MQVFFASPWIPAEWIEAHGLEPRGIWLAEDFGRGAPALGAGVCAFAEATLRFAETHPADPIIFATTCDQLRRSFDALDAVSAGRGFLFNLPATWQSAAARRMFQSEVERLGVFLRARGGRAPAGEALAQIVERRARVRQSLRDAAPGVSARVLADAIARFHWDGSLHLPAPAPAARPGVPLAIVGGPLNASEWGLLDVLEAAGARIVLNATETGERSLTPFSGFNGFFKEPSESPGGFGLRWQAKRDTALELDIRTRHNIRKRRRRSALPAQSTSPISGLEAPFDPFDVLVRGYFENMVDVFQRPNSRLYAWLGGRLAARGARGIVLWVHTGCDLWRAEAATLRETFRLPVLLLEADEASADSPRAAGRIQALVEMLR